MDITTAKLTRDLAKTLLDGQREKTTPYDTTGVVLRIEDDIAWVSIPGGVDETPVELTMNAQPDDYVQVRISGGRAWITGNGTSPPTDDTVAKKAVVQSEEATVVAVDAKVEAESKPNIFYGSPENVYDAVKDGDYLVNDETGSTYKWANGWVEVTNYEKAVTNNINLITSTIFYAYTDSLSDGVLDFENSSLQYVGSYVSLNGVRSETFDDYRWSLNPEWARKYADDFLMKIEREEVEGCVLKSPDASTYSLLTPIYMAYYMSGIEQMRIGYDAYKEAYGVISKDIFVIGNGAAIRFDNSDEADSRNRLIFEIRNNGHFSLKNY